MGALRRVMAATAPPAVAAAGLYPAPAPPFVFSVGAVKTLTGHLEGTAGLAGLLYGLTHLQQVAALPLRYR